MNLIRTSIKTECQTVLFPNLYIYKNTTHMRIGQTEVEKKTHIELFFFFNLFVDMVSVLAFGI